MGLRSLGKETPLPTAGQSPKFPGPGGGREPVTRQLADYSTLGGEVTVERRGGATEWG